MRYLMEAQTHTLNLEVAFHFKICHFAVSRFENVF